MTHECFYSPETLRCFTCNKPFKFITIFEEKPDCEYCGRDAKEILCVCGCGKKINHNKEGRLSTHMARECYWEACGDL